MKASDLKKSSVIAYQNGVYQLRDITRSTPQGRGGNVRLRCVMYSIPGGNKLDVSMDAEETVENIALVKRPASYSYRDGDHYVFLDDDDFTPYMFDDHTVNSAVHYLREGLDGLFVLLIDDTPVAIQLPQTVVLAVTQTPPELKGGTATKRPKPAVLATGLEIMVPEYIRVGEHVVVNTSTGEFAGRADAS